MKAKRNYFVISGIVLASVLCIYYFYVLYFTYSKFDSDHATMVLMANDMLHGNFFLNNWTQSGISFLTTDLLFYLIAAFFLGVSRESCALAHALMYFAYFATGMLALSRIRVKYIRWCAVSAAVVFCLAPKTFQMNISRIHLGVAPWLFISIYLLIHIINSGSKGKKHYILLGFCALMATLGDQIYLVLGLFPILIGAVYMRLVDKNNKEVSLRIIVAEIAGWIASMIFEGLYYSLGTCNKGIMLERQTFKSLEEIGKGFCFLIEGFLKLFGADFFEKKMIAFSTLDYFARMLYIIFFLVILVSCTRRILKLKENNYILVPLTVGIVLIIAVLLLSALNSDVGVARYFCYFPMLLIITAAYWSEGHEKEIAKIEKDRKKLLVIVLTVGLFAVLSGGLNDILNREKVNMPQQELADILVENGLEYGYADFWDGAVTTVLSEGNAHVLSIIMNDSVASELNYYTNMSWYDHPVHYVVLRKDSTSIWGLNPTRTVSVFGEPQKVIESDSYYICVYSYDLSSILIKQPTPFS